ncbi:homoprotocatechuate degradation operon regulator HpaR [Ramlibacter sp. AN1015]|uniref:homoprotocatechuate degradation operon regulator HpaR n=1 Tax=Ramlibacter sp. AN1015 TaxID=3133428 RepID=UPI0030C19DBC
MPYAVSSAPVDAAPAGDDDNKVRRNLPLLLLQVREQVLARFRPVLNAHGVTEQQYRILRAIEMNESLEPRELCAICHISSPSLAGVLARMEGLGLVSRTPHPDDQRRQLVTLTTSSRRLIRSMRPRIDQVYQSLQEDLGPELAAQTFRTLGAVLERLAQREARP